MRKFRKDEQAIIKGVIRKFEKFMEDNFKLQKANKLNRIFYAVIKTEGDILFSLRYFNWAIKAYKTLKDYCKMWGKVKLKMKTYEQIAVCYRTCHMYNVAITYFKKSL